MDNLKFKKGLEQNLPKELEKDTFYISTDSKKIMLNDAVWEDSENVKKEIYSDFRLILNDEIGEIMEIKQDVLISGNNIKTINGISLLGEGNIIFDSINGNGNYPLINNGNTLNSQTPYVLLPNTFYLWSNLTNNLTVILGDEIEGIVNEYIFQFDWAETDGIGSLTLPSTVKWSDDIIPDFTDASFIYQVSIVNNCATILKFKK